MGEQKWYQSKAYDAEIPKIKKNLIVAQVGFEKIKFENAEKCKV